LIGLPVKVCNRE